MWRQKGNGARGSQSTLLNRTGRSRQSATYWWEASVLDGAKRFYDKNKNRTVQKDAKRNSPDNVTP